MSQPRRTTTFNPNDSSPVWSSSFHAVTWYFDQMRRRWRCHVCPRTIRIGTFYLSCVLCSFPPRDFLHVASTKWCVRRSFMKKKPHKVYCVVRDGFSSFLAIFKDRCILYCGTVKSVTLPYLLFCVVVHILSVWFSLQSIGNHVVPGY